MEKPPRQPRNPYLVLRERRAARQRAEEEAKAEAEAKAKAEAEAEAEKKKEDNKAQAEGKEENESKAQTVGKEKEDAKVDVDTREKADSMASKKAVHEDQLAKMRRAEKERDEKLFASLAANMTMDDVQGAGAMPLAANMTMDDVQGAAAMPLASSTPLPDYISRISREMLDRIRDECPLPAGVVAQMKPPEPLTEDYGGAFLDDQGKMEVVKDDRFHPATRRADLGRVVPVEVNYVRLDKIGDIERIFEYEVSFEPVLDSLNERHQCVRQHKEELGGVTSFNGVSLDMPRKLDQEVWSRECKLKSGAVTCMTLKFCRKKRFSDTTSLSILNVVFKRVMNELNLVQMRRSYFDPERKVCVPQHKLEVWPGFVNAVDEYEAGLFLQCDIGFRVLRSETVLDVFQDLYRRRVPDVKIEAEKLLVGSQVLTEYNNRTYKIDAIDFSKCPGDTFQMRTGEVISFVNYYQRYYSLTIVDDKQPMLISHIRGRERGAVDVVVLLVPELCKLTGLTDKMRGDYRLMADLSKVTKPSPDQRQTQLRKFVQNVNSNEKARGLLAEWGLRLADNPLQLEARQLPTPTLNFGKGKTENSGPSADWGRAASRLPVLKPMNISNWILIYQKRDEAMAKDFARGYQNISKRMGIEVTRPEPIAVNSDRTDEYVNALRKNLKEDTQLVVTLVGAQRTDRYSAIKRICYIEHPIASQVILQRTLKNPKRIESVIEKITLQINSKLGGELWGLPEIEQKDVMVAGIDVFHDPARAGSSAVGFVASLNNAMSSWHSVAFMQAPKQELTDLLGQCLSSSLNAYRAANNALPQRVVILRDGVGDGQLEVVLEHEVPQILKVMREHDNKMELMFLVVQKRINTKIFACPPNRPLANPAPGTVLDHGVTRTDWSSFYLVSPKANQGTVAPSRYILLYGNCMDMNELQRLSFWLTYLYYNWCGTIRVPAPVQYAHKLAEMTGEHLRNAPAEELADKLFYL